ncbi:MAG: hypothetical protein COB66_05080 [Coxiella sp. (in: Bacteria)]|nr:MAG: hypothetical protein COB66_05080 [Coxiella sp. (in: g-proteobacteria)]
MRISYLLGLLVAGTLSAQAQVLQTYNNCQNEDAYYTINNVQTDCGYSFGLIRQCPRQMSAVTFLNNTGRAINISFQPKHGRMMEYINNEGMSPRIITGRSRPMRLPNNEAVTVSFSHNYTFSRTYNSLFRMTCRAR